MIGMGDIDQGSRSLLTVFPEEIRHAVLRDHVMNMSSGRRYSGPWFQLDEKSIGRYLHTLTKEFYRIDNP
jgi:hypothetical protein